jgi:hypothetical protein
VTSAAELPPEMNAFKSQQHRWAKGGAQTCRKLLPSILRSRLPWRIKLEAFFHLTSWASYFLILVLSVLLLPVLYTKVHVFANHIVLRAVFDISLVLIATCSASTFYVASQREVFRTWGESLKYLPFLVSLGVGVALNNARAALEGLFGKSSEFVRTPKFGVAGRAGNGWVKKSGQNRLDAKRIQAWSELLMGLYLSGCVAYTVVEKMWIGLFFMCLFAIGYLYVAMLTFYGRYQATRMVDEAADSMEAEPRLDIAPALLPPSPVKSLARERIAAKS